MFANGAEDVTNTSNRYTIIQHMNVEKSRGLIVHIAIIERNGKHN